MRRVLLTGATGFVGRQVLKRLLQIGYDVRIVVRKPVHDIFGVEQVIVDDLFSAPLSELKSVCSNVDILIHSAWYAVPGKYLTSNTNITCLSGTLTLAQAAIEVGVARFVGIGTCFEYELSDGPLRSSSPIAPTSVYGACKASAFMTLSHMMLNEARSFAWCRLFYLYGEGEDERRLVPYIRKQLASGKPVELTNGQKIRDYMDVCEAGSQIADIALSDFQGAINICSGNPITIGDLAYGIADEYQRRDLIRLGAKADAPDDPMCVYGERTWLK